MGSSFGESPIMAGAKRVNSIGLEYFVSDGLRLLAVTAEAALAGAHGLGVRDGDTAAGDAEGVNDAGAVLLSHLETIVVAEVVSEIFNLWLQVVYGIELSFKEALFFLAGVEQRLEVGHFVVGVVSRILFGRFESAIAHHRFRALFLANQRLGNVEAGRHRTRDHTFLLVALKRS